MFRSGYKFIGGAVGVKVGSGGAGLSLGDASKLRLGPIDVVVVVVSGVECTVVDTVPGCGTRGTIY